MRYLHAIAAAILAAAVICPIFPTEAEVAVYDDVLRLHVIAASDSAEDQAAKLAVRDALLAVSAPLLADCTSRDQAAARLTEAAELLEQTAEAAAGCNATVLLGQERYPTRTYASAALPAGEYLSLRVVLGEGAGQNWWCILFPPLCLSAASGDAVEEICLEAGLTPEQYRLISGEESSTRYRIKFKLLEWIEEIFAH